MLGKPTLEPVTVQYQVAEGGPLPVVKQFQSTARFEGKSPDVICSLQSPQGDDSSLAATTLLANFD